MSAWSESRPIYNRLPEEEQQYQGNTVVDALTLPYDELLVDVRSRIEAVEPDFIAAATARTDALDWLAQHYGFTGEYWETGWAIAIKRQLITDSLWIWENKGAIAVLEYLFNLFSLNAEIYQVGAWIAGVNAAGDAVGGLDIIFWVRFPLFPEDGGILRTSYEWRLTEKLVRLYSPIYSIPALQSSETGVGQGVTYNAWYAGFSAAGEPYFDYIWKQIVPINVGDGTTIINVGDGETPVIL